MTKSSYSRVMKKKSEKFREKAKRMVLKDYPKLMEDEVMRKKTFAAIDNANVAVDSNGELQIIYEPNNELENLK
jgi:signal transduction protein with GAF and PtsI domain